MNSSLTYEVFKTMEYGVRNIENTETSQLWINKRKGFNQYLNRSLVNNEYFVEDLKEWSDTHGDLVIHLQSLSELIVRKKEFIADVFMELCCSVHSRRRIIRLIEELIQHIEFFARHTMLTLTDKKPFSNPTNLMCYDTLPLRFMSSCLVPLLAKGYKGTVVASNDSFLYLLMFAELCVEAGFPVGTLNLHKYIVNLNNFKELFPRTEVKMLIFEDSDLHSAIDCIIDAVWNMAEKQPNFLVNVLVQESVYVQFKDMLKQRMVQNSEQRIKYLTSEDDQYFINSLSEFKFVVENGRKNAFEVFQVGKSSMPATVLFNTQLKTSFNYPIPVIGVDAFRTESEALVMCNNSVGQAASVWIESGSSALRISNALEVGTVWINGFDLVHPITSHLSLLLGSSYGFMDEQERNSLPLDEASEGEDVLKAWNNVAASALSWIKSKTRTNVLSSACKNLAASPNEKLRRLHKVCLLWTAIPALSAKLVSCDGFNIEVKTQPKGIVCLELVENLPLSDSVYAITAAVAFGNCAFVSAPTDLYQDLLQWSQCCKFPEGVVSIFRACRSDSVTPDETVLIPSGSVRIALWSFSQHRITEFVFMTLFSESPFAFKSELDCLRIKNIQEMSIQQMEQISTRPKIVWLPNQ